MSHLLWTLCSKSALCLLFCLVPFISLQFFCLHFFRDSTIVEVKDGKFRPIDDPDSWPIAADQPDPVLSPKPEVQLDPTPDTPTPTTTVVVASSNVDLESAKTVDAKTTLNPNVPEFVPSFAPSAQGWLFCIFYLVVQLQVFYHFNFTEKILNLLIFQVWIQFETMTKLGQMVTMRLKFQMENLENLMTGKD